MSYQDEFPLPPATRPGTKTFSDAVVIVSAWEDLRANRRRDLTSALRTAARILDAHPAPIPCDIPWLQSRLFLKAPAALGLSPSRFQNVVAGVRFVLRRLGLHAQHGNVGRRDLPDAWLIDTVIRINTILNTLLVC